MNKLIKNKKIFITGGAGYVGGWLTDQAVKAGLQHLLDRLDVIGRTTHHPAGGVAVVQRDVEGLEVPEQPAPKFQQHLLADAARGPQEQHPAGTLHYRQSAKRRHHHDQLVRRTANHQRRYRTVDSSLDQQRNR